MSKKLKGVQSEKRQQILPDDPLIYFYTFDLGAAASLVTAGFELVFLDKSNPRKVQFVFRRTTDIEKVVDDYWYDRLEIRARAFFDNIKMLKNRIYSEQHYVKS